MVTLSWKTEFGTWAWVYLEHGVWQDLPNPNQGSVERCTYPGTRWYFSARRDGPGSDESRQIHSSAVPPNPPWW